MRFPACSLEYDAKKKRSNLPSKRKSSHGSHLTEFKTPNWTSDEYNLFQKDQSQKPINP